MTENDIYDFIKQSCDTRPAPYPEIRVSCPRCNEKKKYKLYINVRKRVWDCKVCGYGTSDKNIAGLLSELSGVPSSQIDAKFGNITPTNTVSFLSSLEAALNEPSLSSVYASLEQRVVAPKKIGENIQHGTVKKDSSVHKYLLSRGITSATTKLFGVKQASEVHNFKGDFALFRMNDFQGEPAFQARRTDGLQPKYISSRNINKCLYPDISKNHELIQSLKMVVLVEGIFDAISCVLHGYGAYCAFGNTLTKEQIALLKCDVAPDTEVVLAFDADLPTRKKVAKLASALSTHFSKVSVVDTSKNPRGENVKVDFGDVLQDASLVPWMHEILENRVSVPSNDYFKWTLETKIIEGVENEQVYPSAGRSSTYGR